MDFSLRNRHRLTVPQLQEQQAFWRRIAATSRNQNAVALARQNEKIMADWIKYRRWLAQYRANCDRHHEQFARAA